MVTCSICFDNAEMFYTCKVCQTSLCNDCLNMYIPETDLLKCSCGDPILPHEIDSSIPNYTLYSTSILKQIELQNLNIINTISKDNDIINKIRQKKYKTFDTFPICIQKTILACYKKEFDTWEKKYKTRNKEDFATITHNCGHIWCSGQTDNEGVCNSCTSVKCPKCEVMTKNIHEHKCLDSDLESLKFIKNELYSCPKCHVPIQKSSGCSYLTCAACKTKFDHTTNEETEHGGHSDILNMKQVGKTEPLSSQLYAHLSQIQYKRLLSIEKQSKEFDIKQLIQAFLDKDYTRCFILFKVSLIHYPKQQKAGKFLNDIALNISNIPKIQELLG